MTNDEWVKELTELSKHCNLMTLLICKELDINPDDFKVDFCSVGSVGVTLWIIYKINMFSIIKEKLKNISDYFNPYVRVTVTDGVCDEIHATHEIATVAIYVKQKNGRID